MRRAMRALFRALILVLVGVPLAMFADEPIRVDLQMENVFFRSGSNMVHAFVYKPHGKSPFPAVIYNQASKEPYYEPGGVYPFAAIARFLTSRGCVVFIPDRPGHETSPSAPSELLELIEDKSVLSETNRLLLAGFDLIGKDVTAGLGWLKKQDYVDPNRIAMVGHSTGATQTLLLAAKDCGARGYVAFAPAVRMWSTNLMIPPLLTAAVEKAKQPVLVIQAQNDFSLAPSDDLGRVLNKRSAPNGVKVYPPFGANQTQANMFGVHGSAVWGPDVMTFLDAVWKD